MILYVWNGTEYVGIPSIQGIGVPNVDSTTAGKILTNDGTDTTWSNTIVLNGNIDLDTGIKVIGNHTQSNDLFNISRWDNPHHEEIYEFLSVDPNGVIKVNDLTINDKEIYPNNNRSSGRLFFGSTGINIIRSVADFNTTLVINQQNSASTGHLLDLRFTGINKTYFDQYGNIYSSGFNLQIETSTPPASATSDGLKGSIRWDENYVYVCVASNTWKRTPLSTW